MHTPIQYKYSVQTLATLFIVDWLSGHNHKTNSDEEIPEMNITINAIVMYGYTR